jgi:hypothetical protein
VDEGVSGRSSGRNQKFGMSYLDASSLCADLRETQVGSHA